MCAYPTNLEWKHLTLSVEVHALGFLTCIINISIKLLINQFVEYVWSGLLPADKQVGLDTRYNVNTEPPPYLRTQLAFA